MANTNHLALPFIDAAQSQKHVTHNAALNVLDAVVHLSVAARNMAAPPASPAAGSRYLVGAGASGGFLGQDNRLATYQDGAWSFLAAVKGWRAYVEAENILVIYDGANWFDYSTALQVLQNISLLGVGTAANTTNPFSAKLNAVLFTAKSTGEGGTGDLRFNLNKSAVGNTASQLYQTNYSGRAETGLCGNDHFHIKVSSNGAAWKDALDIDPATGIVSFPSGTAGVTAVPPIGLILALG